MVCTYIDMKDTGNAESVTAQMQTKFTEDSRLARANFDIGNYYLNDAKNPAKALQTHQFNADTYPTVMEAMWSQAAIVWYYARHNDNAQADAAYAKMLSAFKDQKTLPKEVFQIGDIYTEVGDTAKARTLQNQVMEDWPQSEYVFNARVGLIKADVADGKVADVLNGLDALINDYKNDNRLPRAVLTLGEGYYNKGMLLYQGKAPPDSPGNPTSQEDKDNSQNNFRTSLAIWLKVVGPAEQNIIKADYAMTAEYFDYAGQCYRLLGEYENAAEYFKKIIEKWPNYQTAGGIVGLIPNMYEQMKSKGLIKGKDADKMILDAYQQVLDKFPDGVAAKAAKGKIRANTMETERANRIKQAKDQGTRPSNNTNSPSARGGAK
jgi:tetratricopeptide (TPR) repeat protein